MKCSDCLDFASLASAALRDFHRCVSNFRTSEGAVSVGDLQGIKSQLFMSGSGGFLGSFPFSQGETLIFFVSFMLFPQLIFADYM